jgi:methylated-DNA-protein-cysteine methyltransferase related protein
VGRLLRELPEGSLLPWHRVINAQGRLSLPIDSPGYREQKRLLPLEEIVFFIEKIKLPL